MGEAPAADDLRRIGVVGGGTMGAGIAEVCAARGLDVLVVVRSSVSVTAARARLITSLDRALRKRKLDAEGYAGIVERIRFGTDIEEVADRGLVIEAVRESEPDKIEVFRLLDQVVKAPGAILASTTSSIPILRLALATRRPGDVVGMHFFSPVPSQPLVELIGSPLTEAGTCARAEAFVAGTLGKTPIRSPDRVGFVVNALLIPYLLSAVRMVAHGIATAEVIDQGMVLGCSHPIGPLRLVDLIGLDIVADVAGALYEEYRQPEYVAPPVLLRMVEAGYLGRKTGRGFYEYEQLP